MHIQYGSPLGPFIVEMWERLPCRKGIPKHTACAQKLQISSVEPNQFDLKTKSYFYATYSTKAISIVNTCQNVFCSGFSFDSITRCKK